MTHVKSLQAGHSSQGTSEPITPGPQLVVEPPAQGLFPLSVYGNKVFLNLNFNRKQLYML